MSAQVAADLRAAADVLERQGWTQFTFGREDRECCAAGAVIVGLADLSVMERSERWSTAVTALGAHLGLGDWPSAVYEWNDDYGRTANEVIAALRAAADKADQS